MDFNLSPFINWFYNYIYLAPSAKQWFGFPVYEYLQQNAKQYGAESTLRFKVSKSLAARIAASGMRSFTQDGNFTPYNPASRVVPEIKYIISSKSGLIWYFVYVNSECLFKQSHVYPGEKSTPSYTLYNSGITINRRMGNKHMEVAVNGNNLLNITYYDHLSRFKNYNLYSIGRNISIYIKFKI